MQLFVYIHSIKKVLRVIFHQIGVFETSQIEYYLRDFLIVQPIITNNLIQWYYYKLVFFYMKMFPKIIKIKSAFFPNLTSSMNQTGKKTHWDLNILSWDFLGRYLEVKDKTSDEL